MRKQLLFLLALLFLHSTWTYAGNPVMVIRCGLAFLGDGGDTQRGEDICGDGFVSIEGHCYILTADDGSCPDFPGITSYISVEAVDDVGQTVSVCIPDCSDDVCTGSSFCPPEEIFWNFETFSCGCEISPSAQGPFFETCGCPAPLVPIGRFDDRGEISLDDDCALPVQNCFDLGLEVNVMPIICDGPDPTSDTITIIVKPAGDGVFNPGIDAITIDDLENCNLLNGTQELLDVVGLFDGGLDLDRPAFVANAARCIEIEFTRDPTLPSIISFLGTNNAPIIIPECPRVFDPCSCRPENIVDADGIVELWYDELTFTGNPNESISVASNNIPDGFLNFGTQAPYVNGDVIGTTDPSGLLTIPFFRTPGFDTDVSLQDPNSQTASLVSSCTLSVDACANIVPTLGEWAVIILGLLLIICAVVALGSVDNRFALGGINNKN